MNNLLIEAEGLFSYTQSLRRDFHRHPELGFEEIRTSGIVAQELRALGLEVTAGVAKTGVVAVFEGQKPGPVILARFDMDALPIQEDTGADYQSQNPGLMHACGHDGHTAVGLTVAKILAKHQEELAGKVKFIFQPAEEGLGGAKLMVKEGVLENPKPDKILAFHLWNELPVGWVVAAEGPTMAASETFHVTITGKGGHGAHPHNTVDPIFAGLQIVTALQGIVSRNVEPKKSAVVSVTTFHAGETFNVIPQEAVLSGTIRTFEPQVRKLVLQRFQEIVNNVAVANSCQVEIELESVTPALINDATITREVQDMIKENYPDFQLVTNYQTMGSEDMAYMMGDIPGCYFFVGSNNSERGLDAKHHHPKFDFDEQALVVSTALMSHSILSLAE